jgi:hypothetical protein
MRVMGIEDPLREIDRDPAIRAYAAVLAALQALTAVSWFGYRNIATLVTGDDCVCWPLWPACDRIRPYLSPGGVRTAVVAYMALGLIAAGLFLARRTAAALATLAGTVLLGAALYALDYRLRQNQTYMLSWVVLALLLSPEKAKVLQALVALLYFWAGTLKFNREWTSGAALYAKPLLVPEALVPASCVYVLVLETVLVWGLFSRSGWVRATVYAQLLLFHAVSWGVVGYFYPLLMFGITAIYPLVWLYAPEETLTFARLRADGRALAAVGSVAAVFSALQLVPHVFPGDTALTGEGRLFALHMFDARTQCAGGATVRSASGPSSRVALINENLDQRTRCDPIVVMEAARRLCTLLAARSDVTVDVAIDARRTSDPGPLRPLVRARDVCRSAAGYSPWRHNAWIVAR